jgi:cation transport protein ChaC
MWIFGYGSLMWYGWEEHGGYLRRAAAELLGYERTFNKPSVRHWGTPSCPCPTLNLVKSGASCWGIAFEFPEERRADTMIYLSRREGRGFVFKEHRVLIDGDTAVTALVPLYRGTNVVQQTSAREVAALALAAKGVCGSCVSYIKGVRDELHKLGINDPAVEHVCGALDKAEHGGDRCE